MSRTTLNFIVDLISAAAGLGLVMTGLVMYFVLPPGSRQIALWGLGRHDWGDIHAWLALSVVTLVLVHLALHWSWVCTYARRLVTRNPQAPVPQTGGRYGIGLAVLLIGLLTGFVFYSRSSVEQLRGIGRNAEEREAEAAEAGVGEAGRPAINGSITLAEAAHLTGQTPVQLKQKLGLPTGTSEQMRLREVMESKGWSMSELRSRIADGAGR